MAACSVWWRLTMPLAFVVTGTAFIVHEQNAWYFARSAFLHHLLGWTFLVAAVIPLGMTFKPRSMALQSAGLDHVIEVCRTADAGGIYLGSSDEA